MSDKITDMLDRVSSSLEDQGLTKEAEQLDVIANTLEVLASEGQVLALKAGIPTSIWAHLYAPEQVKLTEILRDTSKLRVIEQALSGKGTGNQISKAMEYLEGFPTLIDLIQKAVSESGPNS